MSSPQTLTRSEISQISGIPEYERYFLKNEYTKPQLFYNNIPVLQSVYCNFYVELLLIDNLEIILNTGNNLLEFL